MRVVRLSCVAPPYGGGIGRAAYDGVVGVRGTGIDALLLTPDYPSRSSGSSNEFDDTLIRRLKILFSRGNAAFGHRKLFSYLDSADIIHLDYPYYGLSFELMLYLWLRPLKKFVLSYHMDTRLTGLSKLVSWVDENFCLPFFLRRANAVIGASSKYIFSSRISSHEKIFREKFVEIPFGIRTDKFTPSLPKDDFYQKFSLSKMEPFALFVGTLDASHDFKGVEFLLNTWGDFKKSGGSGRLCLVGGGSGRSYYQSVADRLGISQSVFFAGYVSEDDLVNFYRAARVLVLPSLGRGEAFGLVIVEAAASGTRSLVSDLPGVADVALRTGGQTFPVGDSLALKDGLGRALSETAPDREVPARSALVFGLDNHCIALESVYRSVLK